MCRLFTTRPAESGTPYPTPSPQIGRNRHPVGVSIRRRTPVFTTSRFWGMCLTWGTCGSIALAQPPAAVVVVSPSATPPAFLQELRPDDPEAMQRTATQEGYEAIQKSDAWYLTPRALLDQSRTARNNQLLDHLLKRLSDADAPTRFTLDSLPPESPNTSVRYLGMRQLIWTAPSRSNYRSPSDCADG